MMVKAQVSIIVSEETKELLKDVSRQQRKEESAIIEEAIHHFLKGEKMSLFPKNLSR